MTNERSAAIQPHHHLMAAAEVHATRSGSPSTATDEPERGEFPSRLSRPSPAPRKRQPGRKRAKP